MHRQDRAGPRGKGLFYCLRVQVEIIGIDVYEYGASSEARYGSCGSDEGERRGDPLISRSDLQGHQSKQKRVRARSATNRELAFDQASYICFQSFDFGTEDEVLALQNPLNTRQDFGTNGRKLRLQVKKRNLDRR